ncbi:MAG: cytochrome c [Arenicellales bacterium]
MQLKSILFSSILLSGALTLNACTPADNSSAKTETAPAATLSSLSSPSQPTSTRWYQADLIMQGEKIFQTNCASCHGANAQGDENWHKQQANGRYPAPPLDGSAHSWHHPLAFLIGTIDNGSIANGGEMPAFKDALEIDQKLAVLAYVQQFWSDEVYTAWDTNFPNQFKRN